MFHVKHVEIEPPEKLTSRIQSAFRRAGLALPEATAEAFRLYHEALLSWNQRVNLISKQDEGRVVERHFVESAALSRLEPLAHARHVLDLGTGAGFPGLPIRLVQPHIRLTLLDSRRIKTLFLTNLVRKLELEGVEVVCARAEELAKEESRRARYDVVVTRAVAALPRLWEWSVPLLSQGGHLVAVKGADFESELQNVKSTFPGVRVRAESKPYSAGEPRGRVLILQKAVQAET